MGRRALRKTPEGLDLSAHFCTLEALAAPLDAAALFGRAAPLEVEIGSGKGMFLSGAALSRPEHNFLGLEIATKYAQFAAARLARAGVANARIVHGDGLRFVHEWLPAKSVVALHVYFPDPWWKQRHRKRRVLAEPLLADAARVVVADGHLHFWTDVEEYFQATLKLFARFPQFSGPHEVIERPAQSDLDYQTHFERRTRQQGAPVFRTYFTRCE